MVATEELETDQGGTLNDVVSFLGLPPLGTPALSKLPAAGTAAARACIQQGAGASASSDADEDDSPMNKAWRASRLEGTSDEGGDGGSGIGECASPLKTTPPRPDGVRRYDIDKPTEALLRDYFAVPNQRLFKLLGRTLPWPNAPGGK